MGFVTMTNFSEHYIDVFFVHHIDNLRFRNVVIFLQMDTDVKDQ
jgi:hypothetical protein